MKTVAFLSFDWDYEIISEYYLGLQDRVRGRDDLQVVIFNAYGRYYASLHPKESSFEVFSLCDIKEYDGFLIQGNRAWPPELRQKIVNEAVALGKPFVSINYDLEGAVTVGTDNYQEVYDLVHRVLRERKCHRPAFVNGLRTSSEALARTQGFRDATRDLGYTNTRFLQANWQKEAGVAAAKKLLRRRASMPDVVFCCNDDLAAGVQETLMAEGFRVPEDVLICGFDNREPSRCATPRITTIDRDYRTIAYTALDTLEHLMAGEELPQRVYSPARHILAPSCGYEDEQEATGTDDALQGSSRRLFDALSYFQSGVVDADSLYAIFESTEQLAHDLGLPPLHLTVNGSYLASTCPDDVTTYGEESLLMGEVSDDHSVPDASHVYARFQTRRLLPEGLPEAGVVYTICPLRYHDTCVGTVVSEGVPSVMRQGFLTFFLTMLASAIDDVRKTDLLRALRSS